MPRKAMLLALAGLLLCAPVLAQDNSDMIGKYAPDLEGEDWMNVDLLGQVPSISELRGMVIVLFFFTPFQRFEDTLLPIISVLDNNAFGKNPGSITIGITDGTRKATEATLRANKILFPIIFECKAAEEYQLTVPDDLPAIIVIDPSGKVAYVGRGNSLGGFQQAVTDIFTNTPPTQTHPIERAGAERQIEESRRLIREGKFARAFRLAEDAVRRTLLGDRLRSEAFALIDVIESLAYERLGRVESLLATEKYKEAAAIVRGVSTLFRGLDAAEDATDQIERLEKRHDEFKAAIGEFKNEDVALEILLEVSRLIENRRFGEAQVKLDEILSKYPGTEAAGYAADIVARMKENPRVYALVRESGCREGQSLMTRARTLIAQRKFDDARPLLERVLDECPGTALADEAKRMLVEEIP